MSRSVALLVVLPLLVGTGCTTRAEIRAADPADVPTSRHSSPHNGADVAYARDLGVLHEQAVALAGQAQGAEPSTAVAALADQVRSTRVRWMVPLDALRGTWGVERHADVFHGIPGELRPRQFEELSALEGAAFERLWLERLTANYRSSLALSEDELIRGLSPEGRQYAEQVIDDLAADLAALERRAKD